MKKEISGKLKDIANQILALDDNASFQEIQTQVRSLYELLTIQIHLQNNNPSTNESTPLQASDSKTYDEKIEDEDPTPVERHSIQENLAEPLIEKIKDIVAQMPSETHKIDEILEEILPKKKNDVSELEDFASQYQQTPTFERKETPLTQESKKPEEPKQSEEPKQPTKEEFKGFQKPKSLNDKLTKNIQIGLNDRLSLTKHLFNGNTDDYNRAVSQLTTLTSYSEAKAFITNRIKPDYNWEGKEIHVERFFSLIEKRFD